MRISAKDFMLPEEKSFLWMKKGVETFATQET